MIDNNNRTSRISSCQEETGELVAGDMHNIEESSDVTEDHGEDGAQQKAGKRVAANLWIERSCKMPTTPTLDCHPISRITAGNNKYTGLKKWRMKNNTNNNKLLHIRSLERIENESATNGAFSNREYIDSQENSDSTSVISMQDQIDEDIDHDNIDNHDNLCQIQEENIQEDQLIHVKGNYQRKNASQPRVSSVFGDGCVKLCVDSSDDENDIDGSHVDTEDSQDDTRYRQDDTTYRQDDTGGRQNDTGGNQDDTECCQGDTEGRQDDTEGSQDDTEGSHDDTEGTQDDTDGRQDYTESRQDSNNNQTSADGHTETYLSHGNTKDHVEGYWMCSSHTYQRAPHVPNTPGTTFSNKTQQCTQAHTWQAGSSIEQKLPSHLLASINSLLGTDNTILNTEAEDNMYSSDSSSSDDRITVTVPKPDISEKQKMHAKLEQTFTKQEKRLPCQGPVQMTQRLISPTPIVSYPPGLGLVLTHPLQVPGYRIQPWHTPGAPLYPGIMFHAQPPQYPHIHGIPYIRHHPAMHQPNHLKVTPPPQPQQRFLPNALTRHNFLTAVETLGKQELESKVSSDHLKYNSSQKWQMVNKPIFQLIAIKLLTSPDLILQLIIIIIIIIMDFI